MARRTPFPCGKGSLGVVTKFQILRHNYPQRESWPALLVLLAQEVKTEAPPARIDTMRLFHIACLAACILPLHAEIKVVQEGTNLKIEIDGALFTEYRSETKVPCLYPLMSPDGTHLTRRFPFEKGVAGEQNDHPHHIGFWFTHGRVNGKDFWHGRGGEKVVTKGLVGEAVVKNGKDSSSISFTVDLDWMSKEQRILSEQRTYTITATGKTRTIDVTCDLRASEGDVLFGDTKEGSFAIRVAPTLRLKGEVAEGHIATSEGMTDQDAWGKRASWVAYHGPDSAGTSTVVAILDHSENLRNPTWWHARDYGLLTANPFGARAYKDKEFKGSGDFTLKNGESLKQRYRLVLHQGDLASAKLDEQWKAFTK